MDRADLGKLIGPTAEALATLNVEVVVALGRDAYLGGQWPPTFPRRGAH